MISNAVAQDKIHIANLWKNTRLFDEGLTDYYFSSVYKETDALCYKEFDRIFSVLFKRRHDLMLNGRLIKASSLFGMATMEEHRNKGYMKSLLDAVIEEVETQDLITFVVTKDEEFFSNYGFETVYKRKEYLIDKAKVKRTTLQGISTEMSNVDLLKAYSRFVKNFDGFVCRDEDYFGKMKEAVIAMKGQVVGYYNSNQELEGYAILTPGYNCIEIKEIVYKGSASLFKLLNVAFRMNGKVKLTTSEAERIEAVIPDIESTICETVMVRVNDRTLLEKVYNRKLETVKDVFAMSAKPKYLHELF